jgi:hypothetical protein
MSKTTDKRDEKVTKILYDLYNKAKNTSVQVDESSYKSELDKLFSTTVWGFREIILVVIVGMKMDSGFRASTGLYDCNPRAIYEGPIKEFLIKENIPHRKSGPLNIAKATKGLDEVWAAQRRRQDVAEQVVKIVNQLEKYADSDFVDNVGISILRRLIAESKRIESLDVSINPSSDPEHLFNILYKLVTKAPDSGNTPQKIAAFLLKNYHSAMNTGVVVTGEKDSASVTSTTSKKPGDVNEESSDGKIYKVYEVTVKPFNIARIRDSYDCVEIYNKEYDSDLNEIIVICRREDCPSEIKSSGLHLYLGSYSYQNITYYYWDIYEWMADMLQRMTAKARLAFYSELNEYISDINTSEKVKSLWKTLNENNEQ